MFFICEEAVYTNCMPQKALEGVDEMLEFGVAFYALKTLDDFERFIKKFIRNEEPFLKKEEVIPDVIAFPEMKQFS